MVDRRIVAAESVEAQVHHGALSALQALQLTLPLVLKPLCSFRLACWIFGNIRCSKVNFEEREVYEVWHKPMIPQEDQVACFCKYA